MEIKNKTIKNSFGGNDSFKLRFKKNLCFASLVALLPLCVVSAKAWV